MQRGRPTTTVQGTVPAFRTSHTTVKLILLVVIAHHSVGDINLNSPIGLLNCGIDKA
jgi:hypothetical protein